MRRIRITLLVLSLLVLSGVILIVRSSSTTPSDPPRGGDLASGEELASPPARALQGTDDSEPRESVAPEADRESTGRLFVRVTDRGSGRGVEGASVALQVLGVSSERKPGFEVLQNPPTEADARTDAEGEAQLEVPAGIRMRMEVQGFGADVGRNDLWVAALAPGERREVLVDLPSGLDLELWVRAVSVRGQAPVEGASVRLWFVGNQAVPAEDVPSAEAASSVSATTAEGLARIRVPSWRSAFARIDAQGFGSVLASVVPGHETPSSAQVIPLLHSSTLIGTVYSSPGVPFGGASVVLATPLTEIAVPKGTTILGSDLEWSARTDEQGKCRIEGLPPEVPLQVEIRSGDRRLHRLADPLVLSPGEAVERSFYVGGTTRVHGMLLGSAGQPIPGVVIWLSRAYGAPASGPVDRYFWIGTLEKPFATARTDEEGRFAFEGVESGDWWVGPAPLSVVSPQDAESAIAPRAVSVRVPAGVADIEVLLRGDAGLWIRGQVVDADESPVAHTVVEATAGDAAGSLSTRTTLDGLFALGPLAPGTFAVRAKGRWGMTDSGQATVRAGDRGVILRLSRGAKLRGRVVDQETGAACVATVSLVSGAGDSPMAVSSAGRDGTFEFMGLPAGPYMLVARSDDGRVGTLRDVMVPAREDAPALVSIAAGAKLRIRHRGNAAWGRFSVSSDGMVLAVGSLRAGTSALVTVPLGNVTVRFAATDKAAEDREVATSSGGEEVEVVFSSE